jgi:transposase
MPLPAYSPDFMPVEHLWRWLREEVTYHRCYEHESTLIARVNVFEHINQTLQGSLIGFGRKQFLH